MKEFN